MATLAFPARVDATTVAGLTQVLRAHRGDDLILDLSQTERLGGQGGQLLHSALKTWREDGHSLTLANTPDHLNPALERLGLSGAIPSEDLRP
jgi:chemotaxis protein CheX